MTTTVGNIQSTEPGEDQPVLVATDFSEDSRAALIWACKFAECNDAELITLHVVHDLTSNPGFYRRNKEDSMIPMQTVAEEMMDDFLAGIAADHPELPGLNQVVSRFINGLPPTRIVEAADLLKADLIVVGSRGITGLPHKLLGSTAERVVELSPGPVVVAKAKNHGKLSKKEKKRAEKQLKKDKKRMKKILETEQAPEAEGDVNG
jgi:nucleotide-binding universal stress UspA family protein